MSFGKTLNSELCLGETSYTWHAPPSRCLQGEFYFMCMFPISVQHGSLLMWSSNNSFKTLYFFWQLRLFLWMETIYDWPLVDWCFCCSLSQPPEEESRMWLVELPITFCESANVGAKFMALSQQVLLAKSGAVVVDISNPRISFYSKLPEFRWFGRNRCIMMLKAVRLTSFNCNRVRWRRRGLWFSFGSSMYRFWRTVSPLSFFFFWLFFCLLFLRLWRRGNLRPSVVFSKWIDSVGSFSICST